MNLYSCSWPLAKYNKIGPVDVLIKLAYVTYLFQLNRFCQLVVVRHTVASVQSILSVYISAHLFGFQPSSFNIDFQLILKSLSSKWISFSISVSLEWHILCVLFSGVWSLIVLYIRYYYGIREIFVKHELKPIKLVKSVGLKNISSILNNACQ